MAELNWKVIYDDETELSQSNEDGSYNKYKDIDRSKVISKFLLYKEGKLVLVVHLDKNKKLIYRRRVAMKMLSGAQEIVYLVGWQENLNGSNSQHISFIFEDGHIEVVDRFYKGHPWFYPINFLEGEKYSS